MAGVVQQTGPKSRDFSTFALPAYPASVIERLGFAYERRLRNETILPDGSVRDKLWYSRIDTANLPPLDVTWGGAMMGAGL